jgi:23S rRNA-/tRNA-specific pseudouridylate synthase
MLAPVWWRETRRSLQTVLEAGIAAGSFWARSRNLKYLRYVHRLDAETSGVLLLAKSPRAVSAYSRLFSSRQVVKRYLAVVRGQVARRHWVCRLRLSPRLNAQGQVDVDNRHGDPAETEFTVLAVRTASAPARLALLEARPVTGRTHQVRVHLAAGGNPVVGDQLYGVKESVLPGLPPALALRAVSLSFQDPFTRASVHIQAPSDEFLHRYGFADVVIRDNGQ